MKLNSLVLSALVTAGALSVIVPSANAADCNKGTVTALGLGGYTSCIGSFGGNDVTHGGAGDALYNKLVSGAFGGITEGWTFLEKVDEGKTGSVFNWSKTSEGQGTWNVSTPLMGSFVVSLKAGNEWSAYYFENVDGKSITGGLWNTLGVSTAGNGRNGKALSHASIYYVPKFDEPEPEKDIPEPATTAALGLFAAGALGALKKGSSRA